MGFLGFDKSNDAIFSGVNGEVAGHIGAGAGDFSGAGLTDENFAVFDFLPTKTLNAETLTSIVVNIFGGTASFNM